MKRMFVAVLFGFVLNSVVPVVAQSSTSEVIFDQNCAHNPDTVFCQQQSNMAGEDRIIGPNGILTRVAQFIVYITGAISVIMIIIGGFRYVLSGGDSNATKGAKDTIMYAVVGLVVAISSQVIVTFVLSRL